MNERYSSIANNPVSYYTQKAKGVFGWLEGKQKDDNAEGLWRIHNTLYDLSDFIEHHPGGSDWIKLTKGLDITEPFEVHHLNETKVESYLNKYRVREASKPRNVRLTFEPNGFYKTLKRRVVAKMDKLNKKPQFWSKVYTDTLTVLTFVLAIITMRMQSIPMAILTGFILTLAVITSHNYFHIRDNFRMYIFNLSLLNYRDWRISHSLSHHMYPNSLLDLEVIFFDPWSSWLPDRKLKGNFKRYVSWIYGPVLWSILYFHDFVNRIMEIMFENREIRLEHFVPFSVPLAMFLFGNGSIYVAVQLWLVMMMASSFYLGIVGFTAGHHHPEVVHDGDKLRKNLDWGLYSLDTIIDREELKGNSFLILTHFGNHALHHLFPTIDHNLLDQLYPELYQTMAEFEGELRSYYWYHLIAGQFQQLARIEPMTECPLQRESKNKT